MASVCGKGMQKTKGMKKPTSVFMYEKYLRWVRLGRKLSEVRTNSPMFKSFNTGKIIRFFNNSGNPAVFVVVEAKKEKRRFRELFKDENLDRIIPEFKGDIDDMVKLYHGIGGYIEKEKKFGAVLFRIRLITTPEIQATPSLEDVGGVEPVSDDNDRKRKRKGRGGSRQSKNARRRRRRNRKCTMLDKRRKNGFTTCSRTASMVTGTHRTCLQDAVYHSCLDIGIDRPDLYKFINYRTLPVGGGDTEMSTMIEFLPTLGLECVSMKSLLRGRDSLWQAPGGVILNTFLLKSGHYLLCLKISIGEVSDNHIVAFNAYKGEIKDNHSDILVIDSTDRECSSNAYKVFKYLFPGATDITLFNVYKLSCVM